MKYWPDHGGKTLNWQNTELAGELNGE